ncbi:hypothetical protein AK830_g1984 [Neonectria ditissima]|uniref:Uncharacterized protein n=1 Tax=Neonectria ditissima TaxID=78410 RepID=A0A0P7B4D1_9HYPO|nr:hypothetical protein AK830_g1984 [Neonectria ditissima]
MASTDTTGYTTPPSRNNDDDDDDVVGFADAPWPPEPTHRRPPVDTPPVVVTNPPVVRAAEPAPVQDDPAPPAAVNAPIVLTGWRANVDSLWAVLAFTLPWIAGTIISWSPITRISLHHAPREVMVSLVASTVETGGLLVFLCSACCWPRFNKAGKLPWSDTLFGAWIIFLVGDPFATGLYTWTEASFHCPDGRLTSARCQVGGGLITAVGVFRVFAQPCILFANLMFSDWLRKKLSEKQQPSHLAMPAFFVRPVSIFERRVYDALELTSVAATPSTTPPAPVPAVPDQHQQ